jgi:hypothetical protein
MTHQNNKETTAERIVRKAEELRIKIEEMKQRMRSDSEWR